MYCCNAFRMFICIGNMAKLDDNFTGITVHTHGPSQPLRRGHNSLRNNQFHKNEPQPNVTAIPHMEHLMGRLQKIQTKKNPELTIEATLCHNVYDKTGLRAPSKAGEEHKTKMYTLPDDELSMCLTGKCITTLMGIIRHKLVETTNKLMAANRKQIKSDHAMFLRGRGMITPQKII